MKLSNSSVHPKLAAALLLANYALFFTNNPVRSVLFGDFHRHCLPCFYVLYGSIGLMITFLAARISNIREWLIYVGFVGPPWRHFWYPLITGIGIYVVAAYVD